MSQVISSTLDLETTSCLLVVEQLSVDGVLVQELVSSRVEHEHVTQYDGVPCPVKRGPCRHGARCVPRLNDFDCQCAPGFTGTLCQTCTHTHTHTHTHTSEVSY